MYKNYLALESKRILVILGVAFLCLIAFQLITTQKTYAEYQDGRLIDNSVFLDAGSLNANQVQSFLNSKTGALKNKSFKLDCDAPGIGATSKQLYLNAGAPCGSTIPASQIIYYAAQVYGLSPKVILATLQKEQSLITNPNPGNWEFNQAMGYNCPTSGHCDDNSGFFFQIDNGTWVLRFHYERASGNSTWWNSNSWTCGTAKMGPPPFYTPNLYPGQNVHFYDPYSGLHYKTVYIQNAATSAMYCYTPHVFNNHSNSPHPQEAKNPRCYSIHPASGDKGRCYTGSYNFVAAFNNYFGPSIILYVPPPLKSDAGSPVSVSRNADGTLRIVGTAANDTIYQKRQTAPSSNTWTAWTKLSGGLRNISAETNADGRIQLVGVAGNGDIYTSIQTAINSDTWGAWQRIEGGLNKVSVSRNADGTLRIVGTAANDTIYQKRQTAPSSNTWTAWTKLSGGLRNISAETNADGRIQLVGVAGNGDIYTSIQTAINSDTWGAWQRIEGGLRKW